MSTNVSNELLQSVGLGYVDKSVFKKQPWWEVSRFPKLGSYEPAVVCEETKTRRLGLQCASWHLGTEEDATLAMYDVAIFNPVYGDDAVYVKPKRGLEGSLHPAP